MALRVLLTSAPRLPVRQPDPLTWANRTMERFPDAEALPRVWLARQALFCTVATQPARAKPGYPAAGPIWPRDPGDRGALSG